MDTVATIPTGAMAERWKWKAFVGWGLFCGAHLLPAVRRLDLGRRLAQPARQQRSSSASATSTSPAPASCTPSVAWPALAGALVLGPRIGKYGKDGKPRTLPGHHIPMAMLGTFILLFGWFGFNAASTFAATDVRFAVVAHEHRDRRRVRRRRSAMFCDHEADRASPTPG